MAIPTITRGTTTWIDSPPVSAATTVNNTALQAIYTQVYNAVDNLVTRIVTVRKNSTGSDFQRSRVNFIEGSNVTLTIADDSTNGEVDITIASAGIISVRKNSTGSVFSRGKLNFIEGSNVTLTVADDSSNGEVDITMAAAGALAATDQESSDWVSPASSSSANTDGSYVELISSTSFASVWMNVAITALAADDIQARFSISTGAATSEADQIDNEPFMIQIDSEVARYSPNIYGMPFVFSSGVRLAVAVKDTIAGARNYRVAISIYGA